jgi:GlpG protein
MRQIGTLPHQAQAERFTAFLITRGISASAEEDGDAWLIWVRDEDQLATAQQALQEFVANPDDQRYRGVVREATERMQQEARQRERARRNYVTMSERWRRGQAGSVPLVKTVIGLCVVIFLLLNFGGKNSTAYRTLAFCDTIHEVPNRNWDPDSARDRAIDIRRGEVWRLVTPAFMHVDPLHLVFNMIWFYLFGSQIERRLGATRLLLVIAVTAVLSNAAQGLAPTDWGLMAELTAFWDCREWFTGYLATCGSSPCMTPVPVCSSAAARLAFWWSGCCWASSASWPVSACRSPTWPMLSGCWRASCRTPKGRDHVHR